MERKSNGFLKVTGILMIIGGGLSIILGIIAMLGVALIVSALGTEEMLGLLIFATILSLLGAIVSLVAGILGVANAAKPEKANKLYEYIISSCKEQVPVVQKGEFGADMKVELINDGPFTIVLDSNEL